MIITSPNKLDIGKIYTEKELDGRAFEIYGEMHWKYRFYVLRIATLEEYRKEVEKEYSKPNNVLNREFYYEISMD